MNLPKAIEIVGNNGLKPEGTTWGEYLEAIQLLIEAGKRIIECRHADHTISEDYLPGETEE